MILAITCPGCNHIKAINPKENPFVRSGVHYCSFDCARSSGERAPRIGKSPTFNDAITKIMKAKQQRRRRGR